jgi:hypothetical protein
MNKEALNSILAAIARHGLTALGGVLVTDGVMQQGDVTGFVGAGMVLLGIGWSWWQKRGQAQVADGLKKLTGTSTAKDAVTASQALPTNAAVDTATKAAVVKSVTSVLLIGVVLSLFLAGDPASAQARVRKPAADSGPVFTGDIAKDIKDNFHGDPNAPNAVQLTGNAKKDAQAIWDKIVSASDADLKYASQLAANANTPASAVRKQCWDAIIAINEQANGLNLKDDKGNPIPPPDPKLFTQIEQSAEVLDALSPQGKLFTSCAGAAQLAQTGVLQFVNAAVTGVAGMAKLVPIPGL